MSGLLKFFKSSIGAKAVMAVTGILMVGWLVAHMAGNLQMFAGPEKMNAYAYFLKHTMGNMLWFARLGLLGIILLHIWAALRVTTLNSQARPVRYVHSPKHSASSYASRTMIYSGVIVAAFLVYHLLHFTVGAVQSEHFSHVTASGHHDAYRMVVGGFQNVLVAVFYILAQILLANHTSHGISSFFRSMGWNSKKYQGFINLLGPAIAYTIFLGFISVPLGVLFGVIK